MPSLGGWEWVILALIALLLFGGSRLAGVGKNAGRAVRTFKDETAALRSGSSPVEPSSPVNPPSPATPSSPTNPSSTVNPPPSPAEPDADAGRS